MSRFSSTSNRNIFFIKSKSVNIIPQPKPIIEEVVLIEQPVISKEEVSISVEEVSIDEPIQVEQVEQIEIIEPEIKLEEIYKTDEITEETKLVDNPQQVELKKRKSKERFKLLVDEIILNKRKESINGWNV